MRDQWMWDLKEKQSQPRGEFSLSAKKKVIYVKDQNSKYDPIPNFDGLC